MTRRKWIAISSLVLAAVCLFAAVSPDPRISRRRQILSWKLSGSLPYVSSTETMRAMLPGQWRVGPPARAYYAKEKARGPEPCPVLWSTPLGDFWGEAHDDVTLADLQHLERYQTGPVSIRNGDVVLDAGSHMGTFTRLALNSGASRVIAFEPDPGSNACFKRTFEKEIQDGQVTLVEAALWNSTGTIKFTVASRSDAGAVATAFDTHWGAVRTIDVASTSLDDAVERLALPRVDFVKWAIPGSIKEAIHGAHGTLRRFRPRMVVITSILPEDPVVLPPLVVEAVPSYHVFTREVEMVYFY